MILYTYTSQGQKTLRDKILTGTEGFYYVKHTQQISTFSHNIHFEKLNFQKNFPYKSIGMQI